MSEQTVIPTHLTNAETNSKENDFFPKRFRIKLLCVILASISSISCIYFFIDYLYGIRAMDLIFGYDGGYTARDYVMRNALQNGSHYTKNSERVAVQKSITADNTLKYYKNERIAVTNINFGKECSGQIRLKYNIGPVPDGKMLSAYGIDSTGQYVSGYKTCFRTYFKEVPQYKTRIDYWGEKETFFVGYKTEPVSLPYKEALYQRYNYSICLSTFDIGEYLSYFTDENKIYNKLLNNVVFQIKEEGLTFEEKSIDGHRAVIYETQDEMPIRRVIFCANERMYMLETKSTHNLSQLSDGYCSNLNLSTYRIIGGWKKYVIIPLGLFLLFSFFTSTIYWKKKGVINTRAPKMAKFNFILLVISMISLCCCITCEYATCPSQYPGLSSLFVVSVFVNSLMIAWLLCKSRESYSGDYIVPQWMKRIVYEKIIKVRNRKLFLSFVVYPVIILIATPLCFFCIIYMFAIILFIRLVMYFKQWYGWLNTGCTERR